MDQAQSQSVSPTEDQAQKPETPFRLLDLSIEIRNIIYRMVLPTTRVSIASCHLNHQLHSYRNSKLTTTQPTASRILLLYRRVFRSCMEHYRRHRNSYAMVDYFFGTIFRDSGANAGRTYYAITHARMEGLGLLSASQQTLSECIPVLYGGLTLYTESTYALLDFFQDRGALALRNIKRLEVEVYLLQAEEVTTEYMYDWLDLFRFVAEQLHN